MKDEKELFNNVENEESKLDTVVNQVALDDDEPILAVSIDYFEEKILRKKDK